MKKKAVIALILASVITLSGCSERQNEESDAEPNTTSSIGEPQAEKVGHDAALIGALRHVGLTESQISRVQSRLERDDNGVYVYNIQFTSDGHSYEFDIDAYSRDVVRYVLDGEVIDGPSLGGSTDSKTTQTVIGEDKAKNAALNHAKFAESDVNFTKADLETKDGASVYVIEFTKNSVKHNYTVDAVTGVIIDFSVDKDGEQSSSSVASSSIPESSKPQSSSSSSSKPQSSSKPASSSKPQSSSKPASSSKPQSSSKPASSSQPENSKNITEAQAKDIAVKHAKLLAENVTFKEIKTKTDKGMLVYEIEFTTSDTEYEYIIEAATGDVIGYSSDKINTSSDPQPAEKIGESKAKDAAVNHAGLSSNNVSFNKVKLDEDNGASVYEIEFVSGDTKYEYKINAFTGEVIEHSSEKITQSQPASTEITVDQAKEAALKHSGVTADKAAFTEAKLDGSKYEIKFTADSFEYDYEISAADGAVIKSEKKAVPAQ